MVNLLEHLAAKGRFGDSEIRMVNSEMSHVNPIEANIIDQYGSAGEYVTSQIGSGTINPATGLPEYWSIFDDIEEEYPGSGKYLPAKGTWLRKVANVRDDLTWKPSEGKWGIFGYTAGAKREDERKRKAAAITSAFDVGIGDFKSANMAEMTDEERLAHVQKLLGPEANVTMDDLDRYYDAYDATKELREYRGASDTMIDTGRASDSSLMELYTNKMNTASRANFANTGNVMVDRQRENIFRDVSTQNQRTWTSLLDNVEDLHSDYNKSMVESAFAHETALTS
tara:strand:+ start:264 stop:1112 length:849 start_codon:yes stop_codon:yes gene_type:complete